jgi:hypothetical protein
MATLSPKPTGRALASGGEVLAIFHGPRVFSPSWYASGPSVPTRIMPTSMPMARPAGGRRRLAAPAAAPSVGTS